MNTTTTPIPTSSQAFDVMEKLASLEQKLIAGTPDMAGLLREIHRAVKKDPSLVTILSDENCAILVRGLKKQTSTEIATSMVKKKSTKALKHTTLDDL